MQSPKYMANILTSQKESNTGYTRVRILFRKPLNRKVILIHHVFAV